MKFSCKDRILQRGLTTCEAWVHQFCHTIVGDPTFLSVFQAGQRAVDLSFAVHVDRVLCFCERIRLGLDVLNGKSHCPQDGVGKKRTKEPMGQEQNIQESAESRPRVGESYVSIANVGQPQAPCSDTSWVVVSDAVAAMDSCAVPVEPVVVSDDLNSLNDACAAMGLAEQSRGKPVILVLDHLIPGHDEDDLSCQSYRNRAPVDELRGSSHTVQPLAKDFSPPFLFSRDSEICNANVACFVEDSFNFVSLEHQNRLVDIPFQPQTGHAVERAFTVDMLSQSLPDHVIWHAATVAALEVTPLWTCEDIAKVHLFTDGSFKRQKDGTESATWALVALGEVQALPGRLPSHEPKLVRLGVASGNVSLDPRFPWPKPKLSAAIAEHMALFFAALLACSLPTGVAVEISFDSETAGFSAAGLANAAADNPLAGFVRSLVLHAHNRRSLCLTHVRAHNSHAWNECADVLANAVRPDSNLIAWQHDPSLLDSFVFPEDSWHWMWVSSLRDGDLPMYPPVIKHDSRSCFLVEPRQLSSLSAPRHFAPIGIADASARRSFRVVGKCVTYNAMTLREEGKICLTAEQFHKSGCAVVGIQEARGKQTGLSSVGAYMRVVSAADDRRVGGCELWLSKRIPFFQDEARNVSWDFTSVCIHVATPRLLLTTVKADTVTVAFVVGHALSNSDHTDEACNAWWDQLEEALAEIHSDTPVVGLFDANGRFFNRRSHHDLTHPADPNALRLAGVVKSKKAVLSASFDQSGQPIITWKGPNNAQACLDYIMLPHNWSGPDSAIETLDMFENCMSMTDHVPLTFTTLGEHECTVSSCRKLDPGLDVGQMLTKEGRVKCEQILDSVPAIPWATDSTDHWSRVSGFILQRLKEEFPRPQRRPRKSCVGHETWQLIQKRRAARRDIHCFHKAVHVTRLASVFVRWREWTHGQHVVRRESLPSFIKRMNKAIAVASYRIHSTTKDLKKALVKDKADFVLQLVANQFALGPRAFHACLRQMTGSRKARRPNAMQALKRPDGTSVRCRAEAVDVLAGHYACVERGLEVTGEALTLAHAHASDVGLLQGCSDLHSVPTWYRVESACRELQSHKAVGMDGIPGELYKVAPRAATAVLMPVLLKTWLRHEPRLQWLGGEVVPTPKPGADLTHPKSWRNIMLYDTAAKIYQKLLRAEIREHWRAQDMQSGARPGISTEMPHHLVASFIRYAKRAKFPAAILFVDGQDAFYAVFRQVILGESTSAACAFVQAMTDDPQRQEDMLELICALRREEVTGLPPHVVQRLRDAMSTTWFRARGSPKVIHTTSGASPGGPLADLCFQVGFSFFLDRLHQDLRDLGAAACLLNDGDAECEIPIPTWVDDIALLITHPCPEQLAELVPVVADRCRRRLQNIGIKMNMKQGKSECMFCLYGRNSRAVRRKVLIDQGCEILVSGEPSQTLRVTDRYVHLGTLLKWDGDMTPELRKRNAIAHESFRQLCKDVFRNPALPLKTKKQVFCSQVLRSFLHHAGTWVFSRASEAARYRTCVMSLYRRLFCALFRRHTKNTTDDEVCNKLLFLRPDHILYVERARYYGRLLRCGPRSLWALLRKEQSWLKHLHESLQWIDYMEPIGLEHGVPTALLDTRILHDSGWWKKFA